MCHCLSPFARGALGCEKIIEETKMPRSVDCLFQPFEINEMKLPNRIVMAPMTRSFSPWQCSE